MVNFAPPPANAVVDLNANPFAQTLCVPVYHALLLADRCVRFASNKSLFWSARYKLHVGMDFIYIYKKGLRRDGLGCNVLKLALRYLMAMDNMCGGVECNEWEGRNMIGTTHIFWTCASDRQREQSERKIEATENACFFHLVNAKKHVARGWGEAHRRIELSVP